MAYVPKTLLAAAATGYVIDLGRDCGRVEIETVGAASFNFSASSLSTPTSAYVPASGETKDALAMEAGGKIGIGDDANGRGMVKGLQDPIRYVGVWAVDGGRVRVVGH